jgi:diadenosine tetraphosphate (Ap4A) HIT family hydrolase
MDQVIYETAHCRVEVPAEPHIDRTDGGHLVVRPRQPLCNRPQLQPDAAIDMMKTTMIVGEAMETALNRRGIDVVRINYQDNGNWGFGGPHGPSLHVHLYGRARSSRRQQHGQALYLPAYESGAYNGLVRLNEDDIAEIRAQIEVIAARDKYRNFC